MKIRGLFKKAAATLMAAVTALSILPATTAFAAGDIGTISFSHTYDSSGNAMRYNSSATFDGHTAGGTGNYKYRMFVDGENAFCIQPGVPLNTGNTLKKASSDTWNALSANQKKAVGLALLYGYQGNRSNLTGSLTSKPDSSMLDGSRSMPSPWCRIPPEASKDLSSMMLCITVERVIGISSGLL